MTEFFIRTEDIAPAEVLSKFAENQHDRQIIEALKDRQPTILVGSRGVGKSFLIRVAEQELKKSFEKDRALPVYMSFNRSSLIYTKDNQQFQHWMLARIAAEILRALRKSGMEMAASTSAAIFAGGLKSGDASAIEQAAEAYENSWKNLNTVIDTANVPSVENLKDAIEDLVDQSKIKRISLFIDEAAHILRPEQQRQFFTLFRDLRTHCITCSAAVYPGVTSYGDVFQPAHDAKFLYIDRDVNSASYIEDMKDIVKKQADSTLERNIAQNAQNFSVLALAASGNPRLLLKTVGRSKKLSSTSTNEVIREFYRSEIWAEHSGLADKYHGHRSIIDWGRSFIETTVLPELKKKNDSAGSEKHTSAYIWVNRDAPNAVSEAIRMLSYTGIISKQDKGIKATRSEIGTRYMVNLGCLFSMEAAPASSALDIAKHLAPKRMNEYGANSAAYKPLESANIIEIGLSNEDFRAQLAKPISVLDLSIWQKSKLDELHLSTVEDVLLATEEKLKEALYVGDKRARLMRNAAVASAMEYLSG